MMDLSCKIINDLNFTEKNSLSFNSFKTISGHSIIVIDFSMFSKIFNSDNSSLLEIRYKS